MALQGYWPLFCFHKVAMATIRRVEVPEAPRTESLMSRLARLASLELELGWAETRVLLKRLVLAIGVAVPAFVALLAALIVLIAGVVAIFLGAAWQHLVIAGGAVAVLAALALAWSVWRLTHLTWPQQTLASLEETWRWLAAQLRSRLTSR
jgi:putative superfamily III holin-X